MKILKALGLTLGGLFVLLVLAIAFLGDREIEPEVLVERYASESSQFLSLDSGTRVHVRDEGNALGEPLLLLHGSNASLHVWEPWVAILGDEFRVLSLDLPGHGLTGATLEGEYSAPAMVRFVDTVMTKLGVERFHLAGSSMGGRVSWKFALAYPERVDRLILLDASGFPQTERSSTLGFLIAGTPGLQQLTRFFTPRPIFRISLENIFSDPSFVTDEMVDRYHQFQLRKGSRAAMLARFQVPRDYEAIEGISRIQSPTLILWGDEDRLVPVGDAQKFADAIPNSRVRIYSGVGHVPMEEVAAQSAADVRAFLRERIAP